MVTKYLRTPSTRLAPWSTTVEPGGTGKTSYTQMKTEIPSKLNLNQVNLNLCCSVFVVYEQNGALHPECFGGWGTQRCVLMQPCHSLVVVIYIFFFFLPCVRQLSRHKTVIWSHLVNTTCRPLWTVPMLLHWDYVWSYFMRRNIQMGQHIRNRYQHIDVL